MDDRIQGLQILMAQTVFQYHPIDYLSTKDASPSPEIFLRAKEFFIKHFTQTTIASHGDLLSSLG
jgi:hypothetical protein